MGRATPRCWALHVYILLLFLLTFVVFLYHNPQVYVLRYSRGTTLLLGAFMEN